MINKEDFVGNYTYRGFTVPIYMDDYGQCYYCEFDGHEISFGTYNTTYEEDLQYLIDEKLDLIERIQSGAQLRWFDNYGYRDIKLEYRLRILKVWASTDMPIDLESVKKEARLILKQYIK